VRRSIRHQCGEVRVGPCLDKFLDRLWKSFQFTLKNGLRFVNISARSRLTHLVQIVSPFMTSIY
jgi:hypothetical protein